MGYRTMASLEGPCSLAAFLRNPPAWRRVELYFYAYHLVLSTARRHLPDWLSTRALLSRNVATASRESTIGDYQSSEIAQLKRALEDTQDSLRKSKLEVQKLEDKVKHVEDDAKRRERRENWLSWKVAVSGVLLPFFCRDLLKAEPYLGRLSNFQLARGYSWCHS